MQSVTSSQVINPVISQPFIVDIFYLRDNQLNHYKKTIPVCWFIVSHILKSFAPLRRHAMRYETNVWSRFAKKEFTRWLIYDVAQLFCSMRVLTTDEWAR